MKKVNEQDDQISMAIEVGNLLPETNDKVDHYREILKAQGNLLNHLEKRQNSFFVSKMKKLREKLEISDSKNAIINQQKIYENYLARKKKYENWLDEVSVEVNTNFDEVLEKAKGVKTNLRLSHALDAYGKREDLVSVQEKAEFYFYLKQEIKNNKKHGK
jgi:hypothetical protein